MVVVKPANLLEPAGFLWSRHTEPSIFHRQHTTRGQRERERKGDRQRKREREKSEKEREKGTDEERKRERWTARER